MISCDCVASHGDQAAWSSTCGSIKPDLNSGTFPRSGRAASEAMAAQGRATHPVVQASPLLSKIQRKTQKKCKNPNKKPEIQLRRLAEEFAAKGSGDELPTEDGKQVMQCDAIANSINQH